MGPCHYRRPWVGSQRRIAAIAESATLAVDAKAKALRAAGEDVIVFGAGEPDFPTPDHVVEAAAAACRDPRNHQLLAHGGPARAAARPSPRRPTATRASTCRPTQVLVTNGGKQALLQRLRLPARPGRRGAAAGALLDHLPRVDPPGRRRARRGADRRDEGFRVTVDQLEAARTERTKVLVFVSPSNPTGAVYPPEEVEAIGRWAVEHGLWVVTDEIYEHLVYDDTGSCRCRSRCRSWPSAAWW